MDLDFDIAMVALELILVSRARGKFFSKDYISNWIHKSWAEAPNREAEVITLSKGWFMVTFKNIETLECVLA